MTSAIACSIEDEQLRSLAVEGSWALVISGVQRGRADRAEPARPWYDLRSWQEPQEGDRARLDTALRFLESLDLIQRDADEPQIIRPVATSRPRRTY